VRAFSGSIAPTRRLRDAERYARRAGFVAESCSQEEVPMKVYKSFDEFTREEIRPLTRVGFSLDEFDIDDHYQEDFLFDNASDDDDDEE
jgi:hypothetical protein